MRLNPLKAIPFLFAFFLTGCMIVPIPTLEHSLDIGRGSIDTDVLQTMMERGATKEDVLLHFAEPTLSLCGEQIFFYEWRVRGGYLDVAVYGGTGADYVLHKTHLVMLQFDPQNRLMRYDRVTTWDVGDDIWRRATFQPQTRHADKTKWSQFLAWAPMDCELPTFLPVPCITLRATWKSPRITEAPSKPLRVRVAGFSNKRKTPTYMMARPAPTEVYKIATRDDTYIMRDAIADQFKASGYVLVDGNEELTVTGEVLEFDLRTTWDESTGAKALAVIEIELSIAGKEGDSDTVVRTYRSDAKVTMAGGTDRKAQHELALGSSIEGILTQIAADTILAHYLNRDRSKSNGVSP